jgi:hypothetical protein
MSTQSHATAAQLVRTIKAHIDKGQQAKDRSDQAKDKSDQHFTAAGQYLKVLKAEHTSSWAEWEELLKTQIGISTGRASELMQIADGRIGREASRRQGRWHAAGPGGFFTTW